METAYKLAISEYVKAKKDDESVAVETEMKQFLTATSGGKAAIKDSYPVGTILVGQLKWNADPGNHNYMIIITERSGKTFRGIARLDYGPSGNPKQKAIYDLDGEVQGMNLKYKGDLGGLNEVEGKWEKGAIRISASATNGGTLSGVLHFKN